LYVAVMVIKVDDFAETEKEAFDLDTNEFW
jgi:hypothetical protein